MRTHYRLPQALALTAALAVPTTATASSRFHKVDSSVTDAVNGGAANVRVILRTPPACRASVKQSLVSHGDTILSEQPRLSTLTAIVHAADVATLDASSCVGTVSDDARVAAHAQ